MRPHQLESERILVVGAEWFQQNPGGLNRYVTDLLLSLRKRGTLARGVVVGPALDAPSYVRAAGILEQTLARRLLAVRRTALELGRSATLVDAHFALYALPLMTTSLRNRPLVVHFQGPWADESATAVSGSSRLSVHAKRAVERNVYRRAAQCVALSSAFKQVLVERYRVPPWKINVIPPGVDLNKFSAAGRKESRRRLDLPTDWWVAVAARRLVPRTGIDVLLRAWADFINDSSTRAVLLVVGEGPSAADLYRLAAGLGIMESVRFLGGVPEETLVDCYRAADVCVTPSLSLEGFGLVVLESLACGTPVIATTAGGLPEAVGPLGEHLLIPPGDSRALAGLLTRAAEGDVLPDRRSCRRQAKRFSWDAIASENVKVYRKATFPPSRRKLQVVFLNHVARLSGGELALLRLLPALTDVEVHVILAEDGPLTSKLIRAGISAEVLPMAEAGRGLSREDVNPKGLSVKSLMASGIYAARLARWLRKLQPDAVHTNSLKSAVYGAAAARMAGAPLIWHIRDSITTDYLPSAAVRTLKLLAGRFPQGVIANSKSTLSSLGPLPCPAVAIPSPLDRSLLDQAPRKPQTGREILVGMVGRLAPWKGQDLFLQAFAQAFPENHHRAVIAGSAIFGEERYERSIRQLAEDLGLNGRVDFRGFVEDVPGLLSELDVLVHASRIPEPFGNVVTEGMAAGLPVIAAASGGPSEIVADGKTGLLYPAGNAAALASLLQKAAGDPSLRRNLGKAAHARAREFSPEKVAGRVMDFYGELGIRPGRAEVLKRDAPRQPPGKAAFVPKVRSPGVGA